MKEKNLKWMTVLETKAENGAYIIFREKKHLGQKTITIPANEYRKARDNSRKVVVLKRKNADGSYIEFNEAEHAGEETKRITRNAFKMAIYNHQEMRVLTRKNADGSYIEFKEAEHAGEETIKITQNAFKMAIQNNKEIVVLTRTNVDGSYIASKDDEHSGEEATTIHKNAFNAAIQHRKIVSVLSEKDESGSYVQVKEATGGMPETLNITKSILSSSIQNNRKVKVLKNEFNADGSYIKFDESIHEGRESIEIKNIDYKRAKPKKNLKRKALTNTPCTKKIRRKTSSKNQQTYDTINAILPEELIFLNEEVSFFTRPLLEEDLIKLKGIAAKDRKQAGLAIKNTKKEKSATIDIPTYKNWLSNNFSSIRAKETAETIALNQVEENAMSFEPATLLMQLDQMLTESLPPLFGTVEKNTITHPSPASPRSPLNGLSFFAQEDELDIDQVCELTILSYFGKTSGSC